MKEILRLTFILALLFPQLLYAEGSKNLTPNRAGSTTDLTNPNNTRSGYLAHDANFPSASGVSITSLGFLKPAGFSRNGATFSTDHRLYIRVKAGEHLLYGVRRAIHDQTSANQADLTITIRRATVSTGVVGEVVRQTTLTRNQNSTRHMLLNTNQSGVIATPEQASEGPRFSIGSTQYNSGGYNALSITNNTGADQDYWVEFNQVGESNWTDDGRRFSVYDLWDFTVVDGSGVEKPGRMRSKLWSFSAGGANNVFSKDFNMYPLIPSENQADKYFIKKIELAGIAPQNFFRFVTNSMGTVTGTIFEERRKSQTVNSDYPEYFNFVTNPDPEIWPSATAPTFTVNVQPFCINSTTDRGGVTFTGNSSESSTFIVLIDLNNNGVYDPGTADVLLEKTGPAGNKVITWDGLNGLGQVVPKGTTLRYYFKNGSGPVNFPVWDAETNVDGFRVGEVRPLPPGVPTDNYVSKLYWDDSKLATSRFPTPQTQLFGVTSSGGVHRWGSATTTAGDLYTVNTWTYGYTNETEQTQVYTYDCSADLAVTNVASGGNYVVGKQFTYTVTITNNGPQFATGVVLADLIDNTKLNYINAVPSSGTYNATTGVWTVGDIGVGATRTLTITVSPKVTGTISQVASITAMQQADIIASNNSATATITVVPAADIEVKNTASGTTFSNGDEVTYTITARNLGPNDATNVAITDVLPSGLTFVSATTASGSYSTTNGVWTVGNLTNGATATLILKAKTNRLGAITTTATLNNRAGFQLDENSANNSSSNTINVIPSADVAITNSVNNTTPSQNQDIIYTIRVTNNGPNNATNVVVDDPIPAGLTITGYNITAGSIDVANGSWIVGTIANGTSQTLTLYARPTATGPITLTASQSHTEFDGVSSNNIASSTINVSPTADVAVTNTISPVKSSYANGEMVTYSIVVTNNGPSTATNVLVTDKLPASLTFQNATTTAGTYDPNTGIWTVGNLTNGASQTLTLTATINQSAVITTTATQTHTEFDNVNGNNRASNSITSGSGVITADIAVDVRAVADNYYTGKPVTFIVRAENLGPDIATGAYINSLLPSTMEYVSHDVKLGTYNTTTGVWNLGTLASGSFTELTIIAKPLPNPTTAATAIINHTLTASLQTLEQPQGANSGVDSDSETIAVNKLAEIGVNMTVTSNDPEGKYYNGVTQATFVMTVTNNGPDKVTGLVGSDTRTGLLNFISVSGDPGFNPLTGVWTVGELAPGESKSVTVVGIPNTTGRLNLGGYVTNANQFDGVVENNKAVALLDVLPVADLKVTHTVAPGPYYNNQNTTFTITLENVGPDAATGVTIEDKLPEGLTFVSATTSLGTYDPVTGIWTLGSDILPNEPQTLVLTVKPTVSGELSMLAKVNTANEYDSVTSNNEALASISTAKAADIRVFSNVPTEDRFVGEETSFTIRVRNLGPDEATNILVKENLPAGFNFVSASPTVGTYDVATGIWSIPALANNATANLVMTVVPNKTGTITNYVYKVSSTEYDPNGENREAGNNRTTISFTISDRQATYTSNASKNFYDYLKNDVLAYPVDPDGSITRASLASGTMPAGMELLNNGNIVVSNPLLIRPGTFYINVETLDEFGNESIVNNIAIVITADRDGDGVNDFNDVDDNNDGITDMDSSGDVDPYGDADNNGIFNYIDPAFIYPGNKAFIDTNGDGINDWFDTDLDGIINSLDLDMDGDGITNAIEANGGTAPTAMGYNSTTGTLSGGVSGNGMPALAQTAPNNGVSKYSMPDTDKDGIVDFLDIDSDNDGLPDLMEAQETLTYTTGRFLDADRDGIDDAFDASCGCAVNGVAINPVNSDNDGIADYMDTDSDDDLTSDFVESFDDNEDGESLDNLLDRATRFEARNGLSYYVVGTNITVGNLPAWLRDDNKNGIPNFLEPGNAYYRDTNNDGLVDLFDSRTGGERVLYLLNSNNKMHYRDTNIISPLPVTLLSFTAKLKNSNAVLNWVTATELNSDKFIIERSINGRTFEAIGSVDAAGNTNTKKSYSFTDFKTPNTTVYYRLKQIDLDGKYEYSTVVFITLNDAFAKDAGAMLYPNPTQGKAYLPLSKLPVDTYTINIYSIDGRMVKQLVLSGATEHALDLSSLATGKYILRITGNLHQQSINFIKQ
ncbi:T9SS type A sorting domain-containing protein [Pontibacter sp. H249]|uniref:T9SS type A sorting domain-containing protein n=1 Tax=Pontibacter sp. H249 TaxID=3133420 RepID=UPI0030BEFE0A